MRRLVLILVLVAVPAQAQYLTPQDAGAAIEAQFASLWVPMRTCARNWQADAGDQLTHPNHSGPVGEFPQCVYREAFESMAVISRDDVSLPEVIPPNLDMAPVGEPSRAEMTCKAIFKPCVGDIDTLPRGFAWSASVYEVPENHAGYPGDYAGWGFDLELCFAWDEDKDDVGDSKWCKLQGDGNDPEQNNTGWEEAVEGLP